MLRTDLPSCECSAKSSLLSTLAYRIYLLHLQFFHFRFGILEDYVLDPDLAASEYEWTKRLRTAQDYD